MRIAQTFFRRSTLAALLGLAPLTLLAPEHVMSAIYKCVDPAGHISYGARACPDGTVQAGTFSEARTPRRRSGASRPTPRPRAGAGAPTPGPLSPPPDWNVPMYGADSYEGGHPGGEPI